MNYGILPTPTDLAMTLNDYSLTMAFLGLVCAMMFFIGFNNHT